MVRTSTPVVMLVSFRTSTGLSLKRDSAGRASAPREGEAAPPIRSRSKPGRMVSIGKPFPSSAFQSSSVMMRGAGAGASEGTGAAALDVEGTVGSGAFEASRIGSSAEGLGAGCSSGEPLPWFELRLIEERSRTRVLRWTILGGEFGNDVLEFLC